MSQLSLVIPVFNEEKRLAFLFNALVDFLQNPVISVREIIFVNDGSTDDTKQSIVSFSKHCSVEVVLISYYPNQGKGNAVKRGMLSARGDYILMCDADVSTPFCELSKFLPFIKLGIPVLIGSRKIAGANIIKRQHWLRQKMGQSYAFLARLFTNLEIEDFGCGFKIFSRQSAIVIFPQLIIKGWIFDTEALYLAKKNNFSIKEIGIDWVNNKDSRVNIISGIITSLIDLITIRFYHSPLWKKIFTNSTTN